MMSGKGPAEVSLARALISSTRSAALATLDQGGAPFASFVLVAPGPDNAPFLLLSRLALHTRNLQRDPRASLLMVGTHPDEASAATIRLTLTGRVVGDDNPEGRRLFLAGHPEAARYADFSDFGFYRFDVEAGHLVAGFGRITSLDRCDLGQSHPAREGCRPSGEM
jgi:putative heme iron utilization protein